MGAGCASPRHLLLPAMPVDCHRCWEKSDRVSDETHTQADDIVHAVLFGNIRIGSYVGCGHQEAAEGAVG